MAAPLFGYVGDRFGQRNVVRATTAIGLAAGCCLPFASPFWPIMVLAAITYIAWQSAPLQMDAIAIGLIRRKIVSSYGTIRAFGSTAFIVANLTGGFVVGSFGTDAVLIYFLAVAFLLLHRHLVHAGFRAGEVQRSASAGRRHLAAGRHQRARRRRPGPMRAFDLHELRRAAHARPRLLGQPDRRGARDRHGGRSRDLRERPADPGPHPAHQPYHARRIRRRPALDRRRLRRRRRRCSCSSRPPTQSPSAAPISA